MSDNIQAPFSYAGGKSKAAPLVWSRLGDPATYIEPFCGSMAVLLNRPTAPRHEIVNDLDTNLSNFWRAVKFHPDKLAEISTGWPPDELTIHARHKWLYDGTAELRKTLLEDPVACDVERAAWWLWGISMWLGPTWLNERGVRSRQIPKIALKGGIHCFTPEDAKVMMLGLAHRLSRVAVCNGDWKRVCTDSFLTGKPSAIFFDPPYAEGEFFYAETQGKEEGARVTKDVQDFAIEKGDNPNVRIAVCGYVGTMTFPPSWEEVVWTAGKGFSPQGNDNRFKERIWFSPHCIRPVTGELEL